MVWFKVDDKAHSNSKIRKVLAEEPAALALWTVAGSWSADNLTDGFVPDHQIPWLLPARAEELARTLVAARLWRRVRSGYQFHQWTNDGDGTRRNPTRSEVEEDRRKKAEAGRIGGLARAKAHSTRQANATANAKAGANSVLEPPTRPDPTQEGLRARASPPPTNGTPGPGPEPPPTCDEHRDNPSPPPCGRCADARRHHDQWQTERRRRLAAAPVCRRHRGQLAHNCALCRAERLGAEP